MTQLDDAAAAALAYMKAAENVVQSYRVLTPEHKGALQSTFPTLNTALTLLSQSHKNVGG